MYARSTRARVSRTWLLWTAVLSPSVGVLLPSAPIWVFGIVALGTLLGLMLAWAKCPREIEGRIVASAAGVRCGRKLLVGRSKIHSAHVVASRTRQWVRLHSEHGWVDVGIEGPADEAALLRALRLDERGIVARYQASCDRRLSPTNVLRSAWIFGGNLLPLGAAVLLHCAFHSNALALGSLALMIVFAAAQLVFMTRSWEQVDVGTDGVRRRRAFGRARFEPFAKIESVSLERCDVVLRLTDGREIAWHGGFFHEPYPLLRAMAERIERGLRAHRALAPIDSTSQLARGSRSVHRWVRDVREASDPARSTYRVATLPPEELWKTVENAVAPPTARAGAAIGLRRVLDDAGRKRLHEISATCASTTLRSALEAIANDDQVEPRLFALRD